MSQPPPCTAEIGGRKSNTQVNTQVNTQKINGIMPQSSTHTCSQERGIGINCCSCAHALVYDSVTDGVVGFGATHDLQAQER